ncbi:MaoC family dehydratase [Erythrobacter sp. YJ-T3-07]|uniref:MaoC family dehydratase n=1 Tax=Erythrobacter sp. YJ-T3-07 TaxID=2793063 RepID=UPI0018D434ED|nr:MaoC family dehydratase [Erythrobacter sp. YJ-T3-07]MBH1944330.1 MaoC family dehydratase [Erythrobacter sp. YJ-T3-07]
MKYYEDLEVGTKASFGHYEVTREEVLEFASKYDPQPFHLDDEAAAQTYFGRVSASGWHTCAMTMRMMVEQFTSQQVASLGSPGIDELRWIKPVYPGDTLRVESELIEKRRSKSKPHMGFTKTRQTTFNQHGEAVMSMIGNSIIGVRDPEAAGD